MVLLLCLGPLSVCAQQKADSTKKALDSLSRIPKNPFLPTFRPRDRYGDPFSNQTTFSPLFLKDPKSVNLDMQIDTGMNYSIYEKIGKVNFRPMSSMSFREFNQKQSQSMLKNYWKGKSQALDGESAVSGRKLLPKIFISPVLDRIFGGSYVELVPRGFVTLDFGANFQKIQNPSIPIRQQKNGGFQFDQQINLSVVGKIGEKLKVTTNFDNNNSFDFQNNMKVEYTGFKEDILKKLEIGNVSLPLNNTLITGAQNLFGVKAQLQFGKLSVTALGATQRGKQSSISIAGSTNGAAQGKPFEIVGSSYDENRHFFLGQFFRANYEKWLSTIPQIGSGINITRVEVYVLNRKNDTQTLRDVVGFMDMAESDKAYRQDIPNFLKPSPSNSPNYNDANNLFGVQFLKSISAESSGINEALEGLGFINGLDFEKITSARKLATTEFSLNSQLGYITLQSKLQNDEALAVAYQYTYNGRVYKVGELTEDYSNKQPTEVVYLKLLRPRKISIKDPAGTIIPTWNLMMKNIYNLNVTQLTREGFQLRVIYRDDRTGIDNPQLQEGPPEIRAKQLIEVFGLDKLNPYNDPQPDGNFDFVEKITINTETGMIIFPYLEPFNKGLRDLFNGPGPNASERDFLINKYVYDTLYHTTQAEAALVANKNKFFIVGSFKSGSGKDIIIQGFNISPGSVKVYAGGTPLREGTDYTVDYTFGKVTILNEGILSSGKNISITYEQQDPFAFQTRSLLGTRLDYKLSEDINIGSTLLYYNERPLISRNLIGTEPARNLEYGLDLNIRKNSRFLTKMVDALPFLQTKEPSTITFNAEFAQLLPGTSNVVQGTGTSFIDDFENTATPYGLLNPVGWRLATIPKSNIPSLDPSGGSIDDASAGGLRAKLAWYQVDNLFYTQSNQYKPGYLTPDVINNNHYTRPVGQQEIFPYRDPYVGNFYEPILNLAYYPSERGPYNYNKNLSNEGFLQQPENNWGGITTAIRTEVDFDKANIEYIEFWLLDPFINTERGKIDDGIPGHTPKSNTTGGKLVFNLGSISEDLMRDGIHAFENGLPTDGNLGAGVTSNNWGYVTTKQFLNNAFDTDAGSRANQDVGLDGCNLANEKDKFSNFINAVPGAAQSVVLQDPSADDFTYFLGSDLDNRKAGLLERYKNINGLENNSPVLSGTEPYARSGTTIPDNEDLNQDNTLSDLDEYYTYNIDLKPGQLDVGKKYIVDKITPANQNEVTWYLFRIPIHDFDSQVGDINGFKSIRYARMFLTGFKEPVVLRMANFRAVGNRWRTYNGNLQQSSFSPPIEPNLDNFTVSAVNVEDNGQGNAVKPPYIEPLKRDRDNTSVVQRRLNEQSVQLCVTELPDGDARAIYKNVSMDFFNYKHIKMFISAHGLNVKDNEVTGFLRLGTDFDQNYYEIELPLKITRPDDPELANNNRSQNAIDAVWPEQNSIDLNLDELYAIKAQRDREGFPLGELYPRAGPKQAGKHFIRIYGRPDLSQVKLMMIGVRNPRAGNTRPVDICLWADELRLTEFDRTAGWAVNSVLNAKLADLGTITAAFRHTTFGFGGVQSKISERSRVETTVYDITATLNIDKLLPKSFGLKIPMYASYESTIINPNYDPANPDMRIAALLKSFNTDAERSAYLKLIQDKSFRRSLNFTNVRRVKIDPKARSNVWDIENFALTYAFSESKQTNFNLVENTKRNVKGALAWQYSSKFKGIEPFKNSKALSSPFLQLLKDFNFNPLPTNISVRGELDRSFSKIVYRNNVRDAQGSLPNFQKYFVFNRFYNARWSLTKTLSIEYNSRVNAIIDEPDGDIDTKIKRDVVINNLKNLGRMKYFEQNITANYTLPLDKLPITNWLGADYRYNVGYNWKAGPLANTSTPDSLKLGNIIQNTQEQALTGRMDLVKFYNKIGFLKEINTPKRKLSVKELAKQKNDRPDTVKRPPELGAIKGLLRLIMSVRNINGTYNITQSTILPGFTSSPYLFGMDKTWTSPGWGFILGQQDPNLPQKMADKGLLTHSAILTIPFSQAQQKELSLRASLEPTPDIKIQLDLKKTSTTSFQEIFRDSAGLNKYQALSPSRSGSYRITAMTIATAFKNNGSINSTVFNQFNENIGILKNRFNAVNSNYGEYKAQSQDVLIPAFIAAYSGKSANSVSLSPFPNIPIPNWRIDFSGLNKIPALQDIFQSIILNHAYSSTYSVTNYTNSLEYSQLGIVGINQPVENYNRSQFSQQKNVDNGQPIPVYIVSNVMFSEQFAPLIGLNLRTKSKLSVRFEYKMKRELSLTISNAQVTELNNKEWTMEVGFTKNNMKLPFKDKGRIITLKNDFTFRMTVSVGNNRIIQRKIDDVSTITSGNINFQLRPNINYVVSPKLNIQLYVDRTVNNPLVTSSYRRSTTQVGVKLLFNLAQ